MLHPQSDYLLLKEVEAATKSPSGLIHIPDSAQQKYNQGELVEVGPDALYQGQLGDILVFPMHSEYRVTHRGAKYILVKADQIMATITSND